MAGFGVADAKPYLNVLNDSVARQLLGECVFVGSMVTARLPWVSDSLIEERIYCHYLT